MHLSGATTTATGGSLILGANFIQGGNLIQGAGGTVNVVTFTYSVQGTASSVDQTSTTTGTTGTLNLQMGAASGLAVTTGAATIAANIQVTTNPTTSAFTLSLSGYNLTASGNLTIAGDATLDIAPGITLIAAGQNLTASTSAASAVTASGAATGVLRLNPTTAPLTFTYSGAQAITNLTISNDVVLAGSNTPSVTISGILKHDGGNLNFAAQTLTSSGTYTRSGTASYTATTGYFVFSGTSFDQGTTAVTIPNLRLSCAVQSIANKGIVTVTTALDVSLTGKFTITNSSIVTLAVSSGATVNYTSGNFDVAPAYAGTIILVAKTATGVKIDATVWPTTAGLVSTFRMNNGTTTFTTTLPGSRTVYGTLDLRSGVLDLSTGNAASVTLTIADSSTIRRRQGGSITLDAASSGSNVGVLTFGNGLSVIYEPSAAGSTSFALNGSGNFVPATADIVTGVELPTTVKNLTISRSGNVANADVLINSSVTVNGNLNIYNNVATAPLGGTYLTAAALSLTGNATIAANDPGTTYTAGTAPVMAFGSSVLFIGTTDQTITVPTTGSSVGSITINKATGNVIISGGDLTCSGIVTFTNGLVTTSTTNALVLTRVSGSAAQGFVRNVTTGKSHVVGNVRQNLIMSNIVAFAAHDFPVGDVVNYRPATLTFYNPDVTTSTALGVSATVNHQNVRPTGTTGLPITGGIDATTDLARYPSFYWAISTSASLGATTFNLGLTAAGYSSSEIDINDVALNRVKMIRRSGGPTDQNNSWQLQGSNYDNYVINSVPTVVNVSSTSGLIPGGAIYTYGLKANLVVLNKIADQALTATNKTFKVKLGSTSAPVFGGNTGTLVYSVSSSNTTCASAVLLYDTLLVTNLRAGTATITVTATDVDNSRITTSFNVTTSGVGVEIAPAIPTVYSLSQNYPNPFNPSTTIEFGLPSASNVTLKVYNMLGEEVASVVNQAMNAGYHTVTFDGSKFTSGMYIYRITAGNFVQVKKMMMLK